MKDAGPDHHENETRRPHKLCQLFLLDRLGFFQARADELGT
jgi:hypothetical protein